MKILVTGGTGLVGTRLLPRLVTAGIECRALVRAGKPIPSGAISIEGNILNPSSLVEAMQGVDAIVHLAAVLRTPDPQEIWKTNLEGTQNLITAAKLYAPDARFVMASTGLVYSEESLRPSREDDEATPTRDYPASKIAAETLLRECGLKWAILRFGFVYGDQDGHIGQIPHIAQLLKLHPANRLSMIHHRDIATLFQMGVKGALDGRIVNAVDEAPMSIFELSEMAGASPQLSASPLEHPWSGILDGSLARSLGFTPQIRTTYQAAEEGAL
jgi:nucleoside-diphosphate-sugar epimerase